MRDEDDIIGKELMQLLDEHKKIIEQKRSPVVIIFSGYLNTAKTTTAINCARYVQKDFDMKTQLGAGLDQFLEAWENTVAIKSESTVKVCIYDEFNEYTSTGGNHTKKKLVNSIIDTMKHTQCMIFLVGPSFWRLHKHLWEVGVVRATVVMREVQKNNAYYAIYDNRETLRIVGDIEKATNTKDIGYAMYIAYKKWLKKGFPIFGAAKIPPADLMGDIDSMSDISKTRMQSKAIGDFRLTKP